MPYGATLAGEKKRRDRTKSDNLNNFNTFLPRIKSKCVSALIQSCNLLIKALDREINLRESGLSLSWRQYWADGRPSGRSKVKLAFVPKRTPPLHCWNFSCTTITQEISKIHPWPPKWLFCLALPSLRSMRCSIARGQDVCIIKWMVQLKDPQSVSNKIKNPNNFSCRGINTWSRQCG